MSTVIFTAGAKGGTGKSTIVRFLITYLRERGYEPLLLDMDNENRTLSRFFPEAEQIEIRKESSNDVLVERVLGGNKLIIADLKAGTGRDTLEWWKVVPFDSDELTLTLGIWCIIVNMLDNMNIVNIEIRINRHRRM